MKSLILTCLYLFKDTLHRWKERPASPLSRVLVTFFLSLCALSFLANYVLSAKMLRDEIKKNGADLILLYDTETDDEPSRHDLIQRYLPRMFDCDVLSLSSAQVNAAFLGKTPIPIMEYNLQSRRHLTELGLDEQPVVLLFNPERMPMQAGPCTVSMNDFYLSLNARPFPENHFLTRMAVTGLILAPEGTFDIGIKPAMRSYRYVVRAHQMSAENIRNIENALNNLIRFDGGSTMVQTHVRLLNRMELLMSNQLECRTGFCIGIAVIVGILLTALASMEFRQNEYVYTLMKSFGVRPILLILTFIAENMFLIACSFAGAVYAFMKAQKIVLGEFFKLGNSVLTYTDIREDLALLAISLVGCVLLSSIPVACSAWRPIGKVLK